MNADQLKATLFEAAKASLGKDFEKVQKYVQGETDGLADAILNILNAPPGDFSPRQAQIEINGQKESFKAVLMAAEGMTAIAVQTSLVSALGAVRDFVNGKAGFPLV